MYSKQVRNEQSYKHLRKNGYFLLQTRRFNLKIAAGNATLLRQDEDLHLDLHLRLFLLVLLVLALPMVLQGAPQVGPAVLPPAPVSRESVANINTQSHSLAPVTCCEVPGVPVNNDLGYYSSH